MVSLPQSHDIVMSQKSPPDRFGWRLLAAHKVCADNSRLLDALALAYTNAVAQDCPANDCARLDRHLIPEQGLAHIRLVGNPTALPCVQFDALFGHHRQTNLQIARDGRKLVPPPIGYMRDDALALCYALRGPVRRRRGKHAARDVD